MTTGARLVVVSGGGTGIGKQISHMFADQGDRVVIIGRRLAQLAQTSAEINRTNDANHAPRSQGRDSTLVEICARRCT